MEAYFTFGAPTRGSPTNPFSFNVPAALTGTNPVNVGGGSKSEFHLFEGNQRTGGGFEFSACRRHLGGGSGKRALQASFGVFRPRPPLRVHQSRAGMELGPPTVYVIGAPENPVVCGRQAWGSRSPAAVRWSESASKAGEVQTLRDLKGAVRTWRDAFHRVPGPGWNRALHRILTIGPGWNPAPSGPWVWSELARPVPSTGETGCAPWFLLASHRGSFER